MMEISRNAVQQSKSKTLYLFREPDRILKLKRWRQSQRLRDGDLSEYTSSIMRDCCNIWSSSASQLCASPAFGSQQRKALRL